MSEPRRFDLQELAGADDTRGDAELGRAYATARELEAAIAGLDPRPSPGLADRIMSAVASEPAPHAIGILSALRRRPGPGGLVESLRLAWRRALTPGPRTALRAGALAYVAVIAVLAASLTGVAAYTTAGALGLFGPPASQQPVATPGLQTPGPLVTPAPTEVESTEPTESPEPSGAVEPSDDHASQSQEPADDHGTSSVSTAEPGSDGAEGGSVSETPKPSQTDRPSETPQPSSTSSDH